MGTATLRSVRYSRSRGHSTSVAWQSVVVGQQCQHHLGTGYTEPRARPGPTKALEGRGAAAVWLTPGDSDARWSVRISAQGF